MREGDRSRSFGCKSGEADFGPDRNISCDEGATGFIRLEMLRPAPNLSIFRMFFWQIRGFVDPSCFKSTPEGCYMVHNIKYAMTYGLRFK